MLTRTERSKLVSISESWEGMSKLLILGQYGKARLTINKLTEHKLETDFCGLVEFVGTFSTCELVGTLFLLGGTHSGMSVLLQASGAGAGASCDEMYSTYI